MPEPTVTPSPLTRLDALLALLLTVLGAVVRLRALQLVPTLTDETDEIQFALRIAQGGFLPAVSVDTYNGPLNHYLLALGWWAGGDATWPRLWALTLGSLTVGLTYLLGVSLALQVRRQTDDRRIGIVSSSRLPSAVCRLAGGIAASLMAVSFVPVVVNSHLAWSNATTPFWTTLALLGLSETVRRERPTWLPTVGLLCGLASQTHPTAVIYLLGGAVWLVLTRPVWLRSRWPWLGLLVAVVAVSNLIGYNLVTGGGSAEGAAQRDYAFTGAFSLSDTWTNARGFVGLAYQMVGSTFLSTLSASTGPIALRAPVVVAYALVALVALGYAALHRASLPLVVWLVALVVLPSINRAYDSHISARYMAPLLPLTFAAMGVVLGRGVGLALALRERVGVRDFRQGLTKDPHPRSLSQGERGVSVLLGFVALVIATWLMAYPLLRLNEYYYFELRDGRNNARLWQIVEAVREPGRTGTPIILDRGLREARLDAGGHVYKALGTLLDLERIPSDNPRVEELPGAPVGALLVLTDARRDGLSQTLRLEVVDLGAPLAPAAPGGYGLYRVVAR